MPMPMTMTTAISPIYDTAFLAREINDAHRQVGHHAQSMLLEAARAGDALIAAKKLVKHGEFKAWVEARTNISDRTARVYMQVSKLGKTADLCHFEGGIAAFLDAHAAPRKAVPEPATPTFGKADAEYAVKLHRMATSENPNEAQVAATKLDNFAKQFGMAGEEVVVKSEDMLGLNVIPPAPFDAFIQQTMQPYQAMPKQGLLDVLLFCIAEHPELIKKLQEKFQ